MQSSYPNQLYSYHYPLNRLYSNVDRLSGFIILPWLDAKRLTTGFYKNKEEKMVGFIVSLIIAICAFIAGAWVYRKFQVKIEAIITKIKSWFVK